MATISAAASRIKKRPRKDTTIGAAANRIQEGRQTSTSASGEAWTRATPLQTRVPTPKAPEKPALSKTEGTALAKDALVQAMFSLDPAIQAAQRKKTARVELTRAEEALRAAEDSMDYDASAAAAQKVRAAREALGRQTVGDRAMLTLSGAAKSTGSGFVGAAGMLAAAPAAVNQMFTRANQSGENANARDNIARYQAQLAKTTDPKERDRLEALILSNQRRLQINREELSESGRPSQTAAGIFGAADLLSDSAGEDIARAKRGLGTLGQLAVDAGVAGGQMLGDAAIGAVTGGGALVPMAVRSFGSSAQEARRAGADLDRQLLYGLGSAALSVGTEQISNIAAPFRKMFGRGYAEKIAGALAKKYGESGAAQVMRSLSQSAAGRIALSAIGEGGEEVVESALQPVLKRMTYDPNASFDAKEAGHDFLVGAILGGLGGVPEAVAGRVGKTAQNRQETALESAPPIEAGTDSTRADSGPQSVREAGKAPDIMEREIQRIYGKEKTAPETGTAEGMTLVQRIQQAVPEMRSMQVVTEIKGTELPSGGKLIDRLSAFANSFGNRVIRPGFGEVLFSRGKLKSSMLGHGMGGAKIETFAAVPAVIQFGRQIDFQKNWKGRNYDTYTFAAPITYRGKKTFIGVIVQKDAKSNRYYLHEVVDEGGNVIFQGTEESLTSVPDGTSALSGDLDTVPDVRELKKSPSDGRASPKGTVDTVETLSIEGTRPLNSDSSIARGAEFVKDGGMDPLMQAIFGGGRVEQSALSPEQFGRLAELNERGTVGMDADGKVYQVKPEEHIDRRMDGDSLSDRRVNAFQFDHPELHPYYVQAARALIADAELSRQFPIVRRYEQGAFGRQVKQGAEVSAHLRRAMDETGLSRGQIIDAAQRIVDDHGQENAAAAKRVELILDSMLENGWTAMTGKSVPPNQGYIDAKAKIAGSRAGEVRESYIPEELDALPGGSDGLGAADAGSLNSDYDRLQAQSDTFHPEGANAARAVAVPTTDFDGRNISKSASTVMGARILSDAQVRQLEQLVAEGLASFDTITDKAALDRAEGVIKEAGFDGALERYRQAAEANVATKDNVVLGEALMHRAAALGREEDLAEVFSLYTRNAATIARAMQAQSMLRKLSPESQLTVVQKAVNRLNEKYGTEVKLDGADMREFLGAGTAEERETVRQRMVEKAAQAVPSTFRAQFDAWRYLSMLGNPRTHLRNVIGNLAFQVPAMAKNRAGAAVEYSYNLLSGKPIERTKSLTGANPWGRLAKEAREDWANAAPFLGQSSKFNEGQTSLWEIEQRADPFQNSGVIGRTVGKLTEWNGAALEAEDAVFKRWIYTQSLAGYLKANGIESMAEADQALLNRARSYAAQEALRNTFNDHNAFSDAVASLGSAKHSANPFIKGGGYLVEGVLPFKRTPANVLARGVEYSPLGAVASIADMAYKARHGQLTAEAFTKDLDRLTAGLSGSVLLAAGWLLGGAGWITGGGDEDEKQRAFDDLTGHQSYALELANGTSVTLDWLAPLSIPFFTGVELQKALLDGGMSWDDALNALKGVGEPMLEMSMLQGLSDIFENAAYAAQHDANPIAAILASAASGYLTQGLPTILGQAERTAENVRMSTYTDKNSAVPKDLQYFLGKVSQKVPGWDYQQTPYIDAWGRVEATGDFMERLANNFANPAYLSQVQVGEVEGELQRLKDATGDGGVFPSRAPRYFTVDGERKNLTAEEYRRYAVALGQTSYTLAQEAIALPAYREMNDGEKADYIEKLYDYADQQAKEAFGYTPASWVKATQTAQRELGLSPAAYLAMSAEMDSDGSGRITQEEARAYLDKSGYGQEKKADLWDIISASWKKNPYRT